MEITKQIIEAIKQNSFQGRYGGVGTDFKIYFDTLEELKAGIDAAIEGRDYLSLKVAISNKKMEEENHG